MNITQKKGDLSKGKREYEFFFCPDNMIRMKVWLSFLSLLSYLSLNYLFFVQYFMTVLIY